MADRPTCAEALELARAALEDDKRATPGPWRADVGSFEGQAHGVTASTPPEHWSGKAILVSHLFYRNDANDMNAIAAARTREPRLAAFVLDVLKCRQLTSEKSSLLGRCINAWALWQLTPTMKRAIASFLWRSADEAEGGGG